MAKQRSSLTLNVNLKAKYLPWKLRLTLVQRQTVYHWVISGACFPNSARPMDCPRRQPWNQPWHSLRAYDGGIMQAHGWTIMPTQNISTKKFHPVRYYVVEREDARILISHATASWLDLVKVLCANKAPKCKRQVASVTKKLKEPVHNNSHFRTSTPSQSEIYHGTAHNNKTDTEKSTRAEEATSTSHNFGEETA